jgi:ribosomal-protein-alanine N-acetyltransferase
MAAVQPQPTSTPAPVQIRRLAYPDLPQVIAIERRAFPTPWSLAMFVLELSKPSGICLAAALRGERPRTTGNAEGPSSAASGRLRHPPLVGYLICSRYDTVWHVMNIAVDPSQRRAGIATALLAELYARVDDHRARYTLEVRQSNHQAIHLYEREGFRAAGVRRRYYQDNGEDALIMWRTPATLDGSLADVPNPAP